MSRQQSLAGLTPCLLANCIQSISRFILRSRVLRLMLSRYPLFVILGVCWLFTQVATAATDAGTIIVSRAILEYHDTVTGTFTRLPSNPASVVVAELTRFTLSSSQQVTMSANDRITLSHQLQNTGNVVDSYRLTSENTTGDGGDLINLFLYSDTNKNGRVDTDEPLVEDVLSLEPGAVQYLVLTGIVPAEAVGGSKINVLLQASSENPGVATQSNQDQINVLATADISLLLTSSVLCETEVLSGQSINYELVARNHTDTAPREREIFVDGLQRSGVLLEVALADGLAVEHDKYLDVVGFQSIVLIQRHTDGDRWMRYDSWDGISRINRIGLLAPAENFNNNDIVSIAFSAQAITEPENDLIKILATIDFDADDQDDVESNIVCNTLGTPAAAVSANIRFTEPTIALQRDGAAPDFINDSHFVDAPAYQLKKQNVSGNELNSNYQLALNGVYIELDAKASESVQIVGVDGVLHVYVELSSSLSGDQLHVLLRETVPGSNRYRSVSPVLLNESMRSDGAFCPGDGGGLGVKEPDYDNTLDVCALQSLVDDTVVVTFVDPEARVTVTDKAAIDPVSHVFDSTTLAGIEGVTVTVYVEAAVALHRVTGEPIVITTDKAGRYLLPRLTVGVDYSLLVVAPESHVFPSTVAPDKFDTFVVSGPSYGESGYGESIGGFFRLPQGQGPPVIDIPLDPANRDSLLMLDKTASFDTVELGESVVYNILVNNDSDGVLSQVAILDTPPYGFRYVPGSAAYNGEVIADPSRLHGTIGTRKLARVSKISERIQSLRFELGALAAQSQGDLSYRLQATAGAIDSDGINTASASALTLSGLEVIAPSSGTQVSVRRSGIFSEKAILFGKVYVDSSCDGMQNQGEWPIGGVRLYLQDGTYVITDEDGQYSLFGLNPGLHVIKLDTTTLPDELALKPLDTRQAADPESRFTDLSSGDFHRADFATNCPQQDPQDVFDKLRQRNHDLRSSWILGSASLFNSAIQHPRSVGERNAAVDGDLSYGILAGKSTVSVSGAASAREPLSADALSANLTSAEGNNLNEATINSGELLESSQKMGDPKQLVKQITHEQGVQGTWLWPVQSFSSDGRFMVVVRSGMEPTLYVNGIAIPATQIGESIVNRRARAQLVAWYGVKLSPGRNQLEVRAQDSFGNERVLAASMYKRPTAGVKMTLRTKQDTLDADGGRSILPIEIVISDSNGYPASGVYFVTVQATAGEFVEADLRVDEPGLQVRIENGRGKVHFRSSEYSGKLRIKARVGALEARLNLVQIAAARSLIGVGLIELGGQWNKSSTSTDGRADLEDEFETRSRAAIFLKGRIKRNWQMTLAYDTDKNRQTELLRDIDPDEHYPLYGDASVRGYEAQSRSKLYVKFEKNRSSVMWGDYLTDTHAGADDLARVQRTLTGFNSVYDSGKTRAQIFAARQSDTRASEEIRGNGTSMLFQLAGAPIVPNSELIERIVRDRDNPGLVIGAERLLRFSDYTLDPNTGLLRFSDVIPTVDAELNPVFLRISYDRTSQLPEYTVAGLRLQHQIGEYTRIGYSLTEDQNPLSGYSLMGINATTTFSLNTSITASRAAQSHRDGRDDGYAQRVRLQHHWGGQRDHRTAMTWARASTTFDNPGAGISAGREEWRIEHRQPLSNTVKATAEATHSKSISDNNSYTTAGITVDKSFSDLSLTLGARHIRNIEANQRLRFNTLLIGATRRFELGNAKRGSVGAEYERDVLDANRFRFGLSTRLQVQQHVSLYGRYELERGMALQSLTGNQTGSRQLTLGVESDILPSTQLYSEYRMRGSFNGRSVENASGIRGRYEIQPGLTFSPAFEVITAFVGEDTEDSAALSLGIADNRNPNRKLTAQAEIRQTDSHRYYGFRGTAVQRLNLDWTGLLREEFTRQTPDTGQLTSRHRFTMGLARRPKLDNRHHLLFLANWKEDYGPEDGMDKSTYLLSTHQNLQLNKATTVSGRVGLKWQTTHVSTGDYSSQVMLADTRVIRDLDRRWEVDLRAGWLSTSGQREVQYSLGAGLTWLVDRNVRLGLGYNIRGFREEDLDEQGFNAQGLHLGLQIKFDEDWFRWLEEK